MPPHRLPALNGVLPRDAQLPAVTRAAQLAAVTRPLLAQQPRWDSGGRTSCCLQFYDLRDNLLCAIEATDRLGKLSGLRVLNRPAYEGCRRDRAARCGSSTNLHEGRRHGFSERAATSEVDTTRSKWRDM